MSINKNGNLNFSLRLQFRKFFSVYLSLIQSLRFLICITLNKRFCIFDLIICFAKSKYIFVILIVFLPIR
jgi:hypothetical protein